MICIFYSAIAEIAVHVSLIEGGRWRNINNNFTAKQIPTPFIPPPAGDTRRLFTTSK